MRRSATILKSTDLQLTVAATILICLFTDPLQAALDPSSLCDSAARQAASTSGVPVRILLAITRVETGRGNVASLQPWPWAINREGTGSWYSNAEDAIGQAEVALSEGALNFDVGCFQLNYRWHGGAFSSLDQMFDPQDNADYAARFLSDLYRQEGDWGKSVAAYHSRTEVHADRYLAKIEEVLGYLTSDEPVLANANPGKGQKENHFPLLRAGGRGSAGSIVPATTSRGALIVAGS